MKKTNRINAEIMLTCRMEKVLFDKITKTADKSGMTRSEFVRLSLLYILDNKNKPKNA
jgi:antitoxin component of RelBE/YafQ-DinJ toxin-antitoxin module